jgi:hypothetical protein
MGTDAHQSTIASAAFNIHETTTNMHPMYAVCNFILQVDGRPTGEAYVELADEQALSLAMTRHKELMGNRYIEVFNSSKVDKLMALQHARYYLDSQPRSRCEWVKSCDGCCALPCMPNQTGTTSLQAFSAGLQCLNGMQQCACTLT